MSDLAFFRSRCKGNTYGDIMRGICSVETEKDARAFFAGFVKDLMAHDKTEREAQAIARHNIGYLLGYLGIEERRRRAALWEQTCKAVHPIFGSQVGEGPTAEQAFAAGIKLAQGGGV